MATFRLPAMPSAGRGAGAVHGCACGCGGPTKRTWYPGHDGRANGWATRIEKGLIALADVPANERKGAEIMLARHAADAAKMARKEEKVG